MVKLANKNQQKEVWDPHSHPVHSHPFPGNEIALCKNCESPLQKHSYNYYDGSNHVAHVPDTKSSSLRKKKFSEGKEKAEGAEGEQKKKPSFSRYPGPKSKVFNLR